MSQASDSDLAPLVLQQRRIQKIPSEIESFPTGTVIRIGLPLHQALSGLRRKPVEIGFRPPIEPGQSFLPSPVGPVTNRNANGHHLVHRDQPMEQCHREAEFCWKQWCGGGDTQEVCRIVDIPYWRYPRTFMEPPSIEFIVTANASIQLLVVAHEMTVGADNGLIKHTINVFLEVFGTCQVLHHDLAAIVFPRIRKLNWQVLPKGQRPWAALREDLAPIIQRASPKNRILISRRLERINSYGPEFVAVGQAGFAGYLVFGFPALGLFVLESIYFGNATYVLGTQWETLSQLTKAEILNERLHQHRFVHREGWDGQIHLLLRNLSKPSGLAAAA
jgi:hypothetical protein